MGVEETSSPPEVGAEHTAVLMPVTPAVREAASGGAKALAKAGMPTARSARRDMIFPALG